MEMSQEDARKCEEIAEVVNVVVSKLGPATEEQLNLVKQDELPILTKNAEAVKDATAESFIPLLKELGQTLENAATAFKNTQRAAGGVN